MGSSSKTSGDLVTTAQAAAILGVTPTRVRQLTAAQQLLPTLVTPLGRLHAPSDVEDRATLVRVAALPLEDPGHLDAAGVESVAGAHGQLHPPTEPPLAGTWWPRVGTGK